MIGIASRNRETFEFSITELENGFRLDIRYYGDGDQNTTGAGVWPTLEKAQAVAETVAQRQAGEAVCWLQQVAVSGGGWETLYREPDGGRYWERFYPQSEMHGGGPSALRVISAETAVLKYHLATA